MCTLFPNHIECKPCLGGGFTGSSGDMEKDVCEYCNGIGSVLPKDAAKVCDYCDEIVGELTLTPYMADVSARMCRDCWTITQTEYKESNGEDIGKFNGGA